MEEIGSSTIFDQMDKLLDFGSDEVENGLFDSEPVDFDSFPPLWMEESFTSDTLESCVKPSRCTPRYDEMVQLELLSSFFQDSLSKVKTLPICHAKRARSKRPRPATFNPRLAVHFIPPRYSRDSQNKDPNPGSLRRCVHCETTSTPLWRPGPDKSKFCNACGLRNKSGKLFPEYRPIASPTFDPRLHTNCQRKIREPIKSSPSQYLPNSLPLKKRFTLQQKQQEINALPFSDASRTSDPRLLSNSQENDTQLILPQCFGETQPLKKRLVAPKKDEKEINHYQNECLSDIQLILPKYFANSQPSRTKLAQPKKEAKKINNHQNGLNDIQLILPKHSGDSQPLKKQLGRPKKEEKKINNEDEGLNNIQLILPKYSEDSQPLKKKKHALPKIEQKKINHNQREGLNDIQLILPKYFGNSQPLKKKHAQPKREQKKIKHCQNESTNASLTRKCTHCEITNTGQWRKGPNGPRTLCNACGICYRTGRLFPEYRPALSPTFEPSLHSSSHKKVAKMRESKKQNEISGDLNSHKEDIEIRKDAASVNESETISDASRFMPVRPLDTTKYHPNDIDKSDIVSQVN